MAVKLQTGHWLPLGWMHAGMVEQWQFLVVVARVSIFNADVKDHVLVVEHAKRCWEKIREEDCQMVCMGYDSMPDQRMWSMVEGSPGGQGQGDGENRYMAHIRRRHGCPALVGWVPAVCRMTYEQGGEMMMRFRDPLSVSFLLTYSDGLLRDIRYMVAENTRGGHRRPGQTEETRPGHQDGLSAEVEGPCGGERVAGCSAAQGDVAGPSKTAMSHSPRKVKAVVSRPRRGKTVGDKQKKNPQPVPQTGNNADAPARVHRRRRHPGMAALTEIRKLQRSTDLCIPFRPFLRVVREVVEKDITPNKGLRFQMTAVRALMEVAEAYLVANFENTNEVAIHSKRVTIQVRDMRLVDRLTKPRWVEKYQGILDERARAEDRQRRMDARQAEREGRGAGAKKRKKFMVSVAKGWDMLVEGANYELKRGAAEILVLSRIKDITQTPPQDLQELPVIVADGVEYVLLDQLCDLMNKTEDDRNVIHEALHEVTEYAVQGRDLIDFVPASAGQEIIKDLVYMDMCEGFFLGEQQLAERRDDAEHRDDAEEEEEEEYEGSDVEVSGSDVSSDEVDDDNDVYYDLKTACGQVTKGWAHAILSEDAGAEDDANGAAGDNAEPAAQPVEPFDSSRRLAALIFSARGARGGVGMSHTDVDALLSLLKDPGLSATDIAYRNSRKCFVWAGSLAETAGWKELDLRSDDWPREAHAVLWYRDWRTAFLSIMHVALQKCETVHSLEVSPPSEDNSVSGPRSGALSYHTLSIIRAHKGVDENGYSRYVIPLSLYSDKTHTDGRQKQTAYPLMMSLADHASEATLLAYLPVLHYRPRDKGWGLQSTAFRKRKVVIFHKALSTVLQAAKEASHDGITIPSTRFEDVTVHPFLLNYIQDYPERCALANVKFGVCPTCTVSKTDLDVVADFTDSRRSQTLETQLAAAVFTTDDDDVRRAAERRMAELDMHRHVKQNDLWGFYRGLSGDDPQLDYHLALQPDRMHTIEHGIFLHMIDAFRVAAFEKLLNTPQTEILKELDARLQCISERGTRTYPQLVLPVATGSDFFSREGCFEAKQNRSLKAAGKKDKFRKKSRAENKQSKEHRRSGAGPSAKTEHKRSRKSGSKVTVPSSARKISTLKERNESPPSTPVRGKRGRGAKNRPPRAPKKRSRDDRSATTHRRTKKRISYKDDRTVETIDIRGSDDRHSGPQVEEKEEHDRSAPEKSDGAEDEEPENEGDDNDSSRRQSQDTDENDDSDGKSASERTGEDQSAASERGDSPFPSRTLRREGERQARNGSDTEECVGDRQIVQHVSAAEKEDAFFTAVQATVKLAGETAEEGLRSHIAECGIRSVIGE
ncbi:hypothetical protein CBR_g23308 [Chara braunii]|uniref:Core Histone H2A/H2B/H3 domain-containing protein n=1 Tax=Chara braunii TaxID=69332 RepID=A0A388L3V5_CHABU|nr:hypothetical protein CBR_g23308 [Chara braunii]|eukprot:GBG76977.1 hypothetical protein CBR_g23308 [Chara braunii]